jgi:hypothetical protein
LVNTGVQVLFHSPHRGPFHLSLTVLVRYRSHQIFSLGTWTPLLPTALACAVVLRILARVHAVFTYGTLTLCGPAFQTGSVNRWIGNSVTGQSPRLQVLQPPSCNADWLDTAKVWAAPRSLATTRGILSSPAGTEMFQFPACPRACLCVQHAVTVVRTVGLPHSETQES